MSIVHHWLSEHEGLPRHRIMLAALPGVGNVGKLVVETIIEGTDAEEVLRLIHPEMPPQSRLDSQGLLTAPHLSFHHHEDIVLVSGEGQPVTPRGQHECAMAILELAAQAGCNHVVVLAGMAAAVGEEEAFLVCSDPVSRLDLETNGAEIRRDQPNGGVIGLVGLLVGLGPVKNIPTSCGISTTIGASVDPIASQRLLDAVCEWFDIELELSSTVMDRIAVHLATIENSGVGSELPELMHEDNSPMLYS